MKTNLAYIATLFSLIGNIPYLMDVLSKRVKPHPFTWLLWSIVSATVLFGSFAKGAGVGTLPIAASEIFTFIIFIFSLQYGFKYWV